MQTEEQQITELKKVIESSHINFLIGSGASRPFLDTLGDLEINITALDSTELNQEKLDILKASVFLEYLKNCLFGNLFFGKDDISNYRKSCVENEDSKVDEFLKVKRSYDLFVTNVSKLLNSRDIKLLSKQVNIFTTNVDVFFEESLESQKCSFNDGFAGRKELIFDTVNFHNTIHKLSTHYEYRSEIPLFNLFKVHGSLNWLISNEKSVSEYNIAADYRLKNLNDLYEFWRAHDTLFIDYKQVGDSILQNDFSFLEDLEIESKTIDKFLKLYNQLVMINPTKQKFADTTRNIHYYEMLRMYANHLERENSVLFVFGFSFSDEHIQKITQRVANSNPTLLIYILCANTERDSFKKIFKSFPNVKFISPDSGGYFTMDDLNRYLEKIIGTIPLN